MRGRVQIGNQHSFNNIIHPTENSSDSPNPNNPHCLFPKQSYEQPSFSIKRIFWRMNSQPTDVDKETKEENDNSTKPKGNQNSFSPLKNILTIRKRSHYEVFGEEDKKEYPYPLSNQREQKKKY